MTTLIQIQQMPDMVNRVRQLQWSIDWWAGMYAESCLQRDVAWKMYDDAIEAGDTPESKEILFSIAQTYDQISRDAWCHWQNAKRDYLATLN